MNEIIDLLIKRKIGFIEEKQLSQNQMLINELLRALDICQHKMTLKWGVRRLEDLAPHDLRTKWDVQLLKLNEAISNSDCLVVEELVAGSIRGWGALERSAVEAGHVPFEVQFWEVPIGDVVYRVVRHMEEAHGLPEVIGRPVIALEELVRCYHTRREAVFGQPVVDQGRVFSVAKKDMNQDLGF